jgi:hypothetical protein
MIPRRHIALCLAALAGAPLAAQAQLPETPFSRALDRAVVRIQERSDLRQHRGSAFDRDSFDVQAFKGLGKAEDSTLIGWFDGFSTYIAGTDSAGCHELIEGEPTGATLAAMSSTMDSVAMERWTRHWETAVAASWLEAAHPPVNDEEMMAALFSLIARLPDATGLGGKPTSKPRKMGEAAECRMMRTFFVEALRLEEPTRMTLLRGLAMVLNDRKGDSPVFGQ